MTTWTYPDSKSGQSATIAQGSPIGLLLALTYANDVIGASMWSYPDSKSATSWAYATNKSATSWSYPDNKN